jgi:hypothetical protein
MAGRPRRTGGEIADSFVLTRELPASRDMLLHKGKKIFRTGPFQIERVVLMNDDIEWRLFWKSINVVQKLGDMDSTQLRAWIISEIDELFAE